MKPTRPTASSALSRRAFTKLGAAILFAPGFAWAREADLIVSKSPTCGCCEKWVKHMRKAGFAVAVRDLDQDALDAVKDRLGVPMALRSCHTAEIAKYVIEGHVPASDVQLLLSFSPQVRGLAVPGMPIGSPGMEIGDEIEPYSSFAFTDRGDVRVFSGHGGLDARKE